MREHSPAFSVLDRAVEQGLTPCAVARTSDSGETVARGVIREGGPAATPQTIFDLASLTKVVATLPSLLRLASDGELSLDDRVERYFSNAGWFQAPSLAQVTVRQLLTHTSGLPAWRPLFAQLNGRRTALAAVLQMPLERTGTHVYSDLGFMLLAAVVERVSGERIDSFARQHVFEPLGMTDTAFGPINRADVAATENCGWRGRLLQGEVHDENATVWEGVAGHAGLFGTAHDLASYCNAWLELDERLGREELLVESVREQAHGPDGTRRGLAWQLASEGCFAGRGAEGFGHTGFTGTSLWLEPAQDSPLSSDRRKGAAPNGYAILLTNRVHPHRANRPGIAEVRRSFHEAWRGGLA